MFPHEIQDEVENAREIVEFFTGEQDGCVRVGPHKYCLPHLYKEHAEGYYNIEVRDDDVWIVTFPRSGTTWTQEIIWLVTHGLDFQTAQTMKKQERFPFLELSLLHSKEFRSRIAEMNKDNPTGLKQVQRMYIPGYESIKNITSPRHIKSHLPFSLLPPQLLDKAKVVYVARNPKDVAVSYYYHNTWFGVNGFEGDFDKFWEFFERGLVVYGPQMAHVKEAWDRRDHPNLLFLFYEDLLKDLPSNIRKIATFLNKPISDDDVTKLTNYLSFDSMKALRKTEHQAKLKGLFKPGIELIRRGKTGGNPEYTLELDAKADKWIEEQCKMYGFTFPHK